MANEDAPRPGRFKPDSLDSQAQGWENYKKVFEWYITSRGLDTAGDKRIVALLLGCMGIDAINLHETFVWAEAVVADEDAGIAARPAESAESLKDVLQKFDQHFGVRKYWKMKRQEFLSTK